MEKNMLDMIRETAGFILKEIGEAPRIAVILFLQWKDTAGN